MATVRIYNLSSENTSPQAGQYFAIDTSSALQKINYSTLKKGIIGDTAMNTAATTVTGAIAEHTAEISSLEEDMTDANYMLNSMFLTQDYSARYMYSSPNLSAQDFSMSTPSGYTPVAITRIATGNANIAVRSYNASATGASYVLNMFVRDGFTFSDLITAQITVLYVRTGLIGS